MIKIKYKIIHNKHDYGYDIKIRFPYWYDYDAEEGSNEGGVIAVIKNMLDDLFWTFMRKPFVKLELDENGYRYNEFMARRLENTKGKMDKKVILKMEMTEFQSFVQTELELEDVTMAMQHDAIKQFLEQDIEKIRRELKEVNT